MLGKFLRYMGVISACSLMLSIEGRGVVLDQEGVVLPEVVRLFQLLENWIREKNVALPSQKRLSSEELNRVFQFSEPSLDDLNTVAQKIFLRPLDVERVHLLSQEEDASLKIYRAELLQIFEGIGHLKSVQPKRREYTYILLNGSTVPDMRSRLKTLVSYVEKGKLDLRRTKLVFLTGKRALFKKKNGEQWEQKALFDILPDSVDLDWREPAEIPTTEDQAMEWIWKQTKLPPSLRALKPVIIVACPEKDSSGKIRRPNTFDTVNAWIKKENPTPGVCLSVSHQPFVFYQQEAISYILQRSDQRRFIVEGVGDEPKKFYLQNPGVIKVLLDNLARVLYIELELQKNKKPFFRNAH